MTPQTETLYKIGLNASCPVHQITVGGQCFPRTSEVVSGWGSQTKRSEIQGAVVLMQPGQIDKIKSELQFKVLRSTQGKKARCRVFDTRGKRYKKLPGDVPAGQFVYCKDMAPEDNPHAGGPEHAPMVPVEAKAPAEVETSAPKAEKPKKPESKLSHKPKAEKPKKGKGDKPLF